MGIYRGVDILVSPSGDLCIQANRDFPIAQGSGVLQQDIAFRLRTNQGEFVPHPETGSGLDELIGEPNSRETAAIGETKITSALTIDGMVSSIDLFVKGVPIAMDKVVYYTFVNAGTSQWNVTPSVIFNTYNGFVNIPGD